MAANLESMGKTAEAVTTYRSVAADYPQSYNAPLALLAQAQLLKKEGKADEARQVVETLMTQYRDSYATFEAGRLLKELKPAPVPVAAPAAAMQQGVAPAVASPAQQAPAAPAASAPATGGKSAAVSPAAVTTPAASASPKQ